MSRQKSSSRVRSSLTHSMPVSFFFTSSQGNVDVSVASPVVSPALSPEVIQADYERLSSLGDLLSKAGVNVLVEQLKDATIETLMHEGEHQWKADLIIVGSYHHGTLYNWFIGSYTNEVLKVA